MTALLAVEVRRFLARRVVRLFGLLILAGILIAGLIVFIRSQRTDPAALAVGVETGFQLTSLTNVFKGTTVPLVMLAWVVAASFIGADWHTGTMATTLTWEPRRVRLLVGKALACLGLTLIGFVAVQALLGLVLYPAAAIRGSTLGADGAWLAETARVVLRGASLAVIAAALGFSIASVARNTAAGVGLGFAYVVIGESLLAGLLPWLLEWLIVPNAVIVVGGPQGTIPGRNSLGAGLLLGAYAAAALAFATTLFRARDVT